MKKLTAMLAMLLSVSILLCACGSKADGGDTADDSNSGEGDKILVGMVTDMAIDQAEWLQNLVAGVDEYNKSNEYKDQNGQRDCYGFSSFRHRFPLSPFTGKHQPSAMRCIRLAIDEKHSERKVRSDAKLTGRHEKLPSGFQPARTAEAS